MASPTSCIWVIFTLFHLLQLLSAEEHGGQNCPSSFSCNQLGTLSYPFTTFFRPNCGLYAVNCTSPIASMGLTNFSLWFDVSVSVSNKSFILGDPFLVHALSTICSVFDDQQASFNDQLPKSSSVSSRVLWNQTLWKCTKVLHKSDKSIRLVQNCSDRGYIYRDVDCISGGGLCKDSKNGGHQFRIPNCSKFNYPKFLLVQLSDKCSDCISGGGLCQDSKNGGHQFHCIKGRRRLILQLCLGGIIALFVLGFIFWHLRKMKSEPSKVGSRNISAETDLGRSKMYFSLPIFSYDELEESTKDFDPAMELGDGGFGTVYYGKLKDGREVAVKRLYERNYRQLEQFMNEIQILTSLRHRNLVTLYGCTSRRSRELLLVYEYVPNGTIADHLNGDRAKCGTLTWSIRMSIAIETARALSYLHASDIIHRDVKSNNILLDNNFSVKVADFGLSRLFPNDVTHVSTVPQGTPGYLDPEYHNCYQLTGKSDVYSFGVVLLELISSLPAIDITRKEGEINLSCYAMNRIRSCKLQELIDPGLRFESNFKVRRMTTAVAEVAFQCLQDKKEFRPSMEEVLEALQNIESADYSEVTVEQKDKKDGKSITQTESDYVWLLRQSDNPLSPNSVIHNWSPK